jgi:tetratricopeptide (TPR) repeat protein
MKRGITYGRRLCLFLVGASLLLGFAGTTQTTQAAAPSRQAVSLAALALSDPSAVIQNSDGRLEVFVQGSDGGLWHAWQTVANGNWSGFQSLGGALTSRPVVARNSDGRLEVDHCGQALGVYRDIDDQAGIGFALFTLAGVAGGVGRIAEAVDCLEQAGHIARRRHDERSEAHVLHQLGLANGSLGRWAKAIDCYQRELAIGRRIGDRGSGIGQAWRGC